LFALALEGLGKAKIEGYYLDNPVKTAMNKRVAYVNLVRKLREAVKMNMNMAYPNPSLVLPQPTIGPVDHTIGPIARQ
jgi:hypothetical protein